MRSEDPAVSALTWKKGKCGYRCVMVGHGMKMGWLLFNQVGDGSVLNLKVVVPLHNY